MFIFKEDKLDEKLVVATRNEFDFLKTQIEQNLTLKKQLTIPLKELPQYNHLYTGLPHVGEHSLLAVLEFLVIEGDSKLLFSKAGNQFTGFIAYMEKGKIIFGIKMASFFDDKVKANNILANDLRNFINKEMPKHDVIEWEVEKDNKHAIDLYQKAIPKWFPQYILNWNWSSKINRWIYTLKK